MTRGGIGTMTARWLQLVTAGSVLHAAKEAARAGTENSNGRCQDEQGERGGTLATSSNSITSQNLESRSNCRPECRIYQ